MQTELLNLCTVLKCTETFLDTATVVTTSAMHVYLFLVSIPIGSEDADGNEGKDPRAVAHS